MATTLLNLSPDVIAAKKAATNATMGPTMVTTPAPRTGLAPTASDVATSKAISAKAAANRQVGSPVVTGYPPNATPDQKAATDAQNKAAADAYQAAHPTVAGIPQSVDGHYYVGGPGASSEPGIKALTAAGVPKDQIYVYNPRSGAPDGYVPAGTKVTSGPLASTLSPASSGAGDTALKISDTLPWTRVLQGKSPFGGLSGAGNPLGGSGTSTPPPQIAPVPYTPTATPVITAPTIAPTPTIAQQPAIMAAQIQAAQLRPTVLAQTQAPIQAGISQAGQSTAAQAQAGQIAGTYLAPQQQAIQAQQVQAALAAQQAGLYATPVDAAQAQATILAPTVLARNTTIAPVATATQTDLGPIAQATKETIDTSPEAQFRAQQEGLISGLNGAIAGTDPSVAAIMLRQATERNIANQYAQAASASGMNVGLAQRQAMINAADLNQESIGQQALLRAQEIATARGQLGGVLNEGRTTDVGLATSQAGLNQGVNLANVQAVNTGALAVLDATTKTKLANAGFINTQNMNQAQLDQAIQLANAGFQNTAATTQAQLDAAQKALNVTEKNKVMLANAVNQLDAAKTTATLAQQVVLANASAENVARLENAKNALAAATTNVTLAQQVALANTGAENNTAQVNAQLLNTTNNNNAQLSTQSSIANAGNQTQSSVANANNVTSANTATSQLANAISIANANNQSSESVAQGGFTNAANIATGNNQTQANISTATLNNAVNINNANNQTQSDIAQGGWQSAANINNAGNAVTTRGQDITATQDAAGNAITQRGQDVTYATGMADANAKAQAANNQLYGDLGKIAAPFIFGTPAPTGSSDRRAKKDISGAKSDIDKLLADLKQAYSYKYKNPQAPGAAPGERFGPMAQDIEKSKVGKAMVHDTPAGKMVDMNAAVMAALSGLGRVSSRLDKIEKRAAAR
jgi:hypothetical protein